jgi:hypothetical protein
MMTTTMMGMMVWSLILQGMLQYAISTLSLAVGILTCLQGLPTYQLLSPPDEQCGQGEHQPSNILKRTRRLVSERRDRMF